MANYGLFILLATLTVLSPGPGGGVDDFKLPAAWLDWLAARYLWSSTPPY